MSTPLRTFTGFKGVCAFAQIGEVQFAILAASQREIDILWAGILTEAGPLDPAGCKRAILIEQCTLPDRPAAISRCQQCSQPLTPGRECSVCHSVAFAGAVIAHVDREAAAPCVAASRQSAADLSAPGDDIPEIVTNIDPDDPNP